jgi:Thaumatin family
MSVIRATLSVLLFLNVISITQALERVINMRNLCTEPVWFGFAGGSVRNRATPDSTQCGGDGDCFQGSKCIQTGNIRQCFFINPKPNDNNFKLDQGQSKDIQIPIYDNGLDIIWSGAVTGRTGCAKGQDCKTADCGDDGNMGCVPSRGFMQPATQAEFTFAKTFIDFYDVEVINGVHMGVSMGPTNTPGGVNPYQCGNPGSKYPNNAKLGSCDWNLVPPRNEY